MNTINKIKLLNFKRYETFEVAFDEKINLLIGDNEAGKSSILTAIDLVISGSRNKVETIGLEYLFNSNVIENFLTSDKNYAKLPKLEIELFLSEQNNEETNGTINSEKIAVDGLKLICKPNDEFGTDIKKILQQENCIFPFEYYSIEFKTFADQSYSGYKKYLKHIFIDNSQVSSEYAMKEYVKDIYNSSVNSTIEKYNHQHEYRSHKESFKNNAFKDINARLGEYKFAIKSNSKSNLETDLTIFEGNISIDNKGKGRQCIIKTELALSRNDNDLEIILLEEPENHLSHSNMKKLIQKISASDNKQIFIATHSDLISTRLDLRKSILLNSTTIKPLKLSNLPDHTAKFFIKAPDNNILEFILSKKVILVEGDSEYILAEALFKQVTGLEIDDCNIHIISVDGTSFKRYLDIAKILNIKTAVIRDNDGNYQDNCIENYSDYIKDNIKIFADSNNTRSTFEICIYQDNTAICDELFKGGIRIYKNGRESLTVEQFMINNKAEVAYTLLDKKNSEIISPQYITDALKWIKE
ncbi:ATP-dependent endonuclease [Flavobacterium sp. GSP6]|uniref:ATP-dependent nuclease n=1 Tax=Flavobacterium sp. GSP6 TaxID=2497488 RepID=UPI000F89ACC0|nr:TOPRIM nucleotidyl transferase/hydrolase domain-containing protein [Flavobacterium sp. GSP6]RTZ03128.1 ATP-dependent endonuclease [Flavobacterium sp. GSP6]